MTKKWLAKQALWQIYLPAPRYILRPKFDVFSPNAVHQADLMPHDKLPKSSKVYKYALTVLDVASRYKAAEPLTSKESEEVSRAFQKIYRREPLKWPHLLQNATPYMRPVGVYEKKLSPQFNVRYLYYPGELEGGGRRATDPIWSLKVYNIQKVVTKPHEPVVYYLYDGPKRGFVREELMVVPPGTQLPPAGL